MVRKHNRRAAKAAFAVAMGVALLLGGTTAASAAPERRGDADHRRGEELHRAVRARPALQAGARGEGPEGGVQGEHRLDRDRREGAHERPGHALPGVHGRDAERHLRAQDDAEDRARDLHLAKTLWGRRGYALGRQTPFQDRDAIAVLRTTATRYGLKTIGDLRKVPDLSLAAFPEFETRHIAADGPVGMSTAYGLRNIEFKPLAGISAYTLLDRRESRRRHLHHRPAADLDEVRRAPGSAQRVRLPARGADRLEEARRREPDRAADAEQGQPAAHARAMIAMNKAVAIDKRGRRGRGGVPEGERPD